MNNRAWTLAVSILVLTCHPAVATILSVATNGNDTYPGSEEKPFATLERARDEIRHRKASGPLPAGGITVEVQGGVYQLARPVQFTDQDSGTEDAPIIYRSRPGEVVRIVGGRTVAGWQPVTDPAILKRWVPAAQGRVFQADLKVLGMTDLQGIGDASVYQSDPGLELFFLDKPMTLARYPNSGYLNIADVLDGQGIAASGRVQSPEGRFICDDPRSTHWAAEKGIWLHGFWVWDWADQRIPLGNVDPATHTLSLAPQPGHSYEIRKGQWFYAENALSELDSPGEWYLDRETSVLYFWPPAPLASGQAAVSMVRDLVQLNNASNISIRGLLIEAGRGSGVIIKGGSNVRLIGCTVRNMGKWGVKIYGGTKHGVVGCDIYQTGQGGIHLEGGDRQTLTPGGHYADNNHVHHTARWDPVYQQGITAFGVGNRVTHNLIDHVPHVAIGFSGNDHVIEYNEIHTAVFQSNDAGAIYTSPPDETWSMRGHKIRYNYLHAIHGFRGKGCLGVYLDDCFSSADISGNLFYDVATAILIGGGRDNVMTNNMFINCGRAFSIDARGLGWAKGVGDFATKELISLNYQQPPWSVRYPELLNILDDEPLAPKGNVVARNICWGGKWGSTEQIALPYITFKDNLLDADPHLSDPARGDFQLRDDSPALKLGFQRIPVEKIGLYQSDERASWPVPPMAGPQATIESQHKFIPTFAVKYGGSGGWPVLDEAARFDLLVMGAGTARDETQPGIAGNTWQVLKRLNPNLVMLLYEIGPGEYNTANWGRIGQGWDWIKSEHGPGCADRWTAIGLKSGQCLQGKAYGNERLMIPGNAAWQQYWLENVYAKSWQDRAQPTAIADGIFSDNTSYAMPYLGGWYCEGHPDTPDVPADYYSGEQFNAAVYHQQMKSFFARAFPWLAARKVKIGLNFGDMVRRPEDWKELDDEANAPLAAMEEGAFVHPWGGKGSFVFRSESEWLRQIEVMRKLKHVRALMNVHGPVAGDAKGGDRMEGCDAAGNRAWDVLWYALTSFLQGINEERSNACLNFTIWGYMEFHWFKEFDPSYLHLGQVRGESRRLESRQGHVYLREFDDGWAVVNATAQPALGIAVPEGEARIVDHDNFERPELRPLVKQFDLAAHRGIVLLKAGRQIGISDNPR